MISNQTGSMETRLARTLALPGDLKPGEFFGDVDDVVGLKVKVVFVVAVQNGAEVDDKALRGVVVAPDDVDGFQVGAGVIKSAGLHNGFECGDGLIGGDFAGAQDASGDEHGEGGGDDLDGDLAGGDLGGVKFNQVLLQFGGGKAGGLDIADEGEGDFAIQADLLGGIKVGRAGKGNFNGVAFMQDGGLGIWRGRIRILLCEGGIIGGGEGIVEGGLATAIGGGGGRRLRVVVFVGAATGQRKNRGQQQR